MKNTKESVKAKREKIAIKTYPVGEPEKNPMFFERRVYQGSCGKVYPVPFIDKVFDEPQMREYDAVTLENEYVRLVLLPELGGRIYIAQDKKNGNYDFFYRNDVIKPALVGLAGPWISGGVEFNWPQHHRPATFMPTDVHIERDRQDGSVTVWMSDHDPLTRMKGMHGICLRPGSCLVELKARLTNRTPFTQTFLWWANVAARVHDKYESFFPPDVEYVADHAVRAMTTFPESNGVYYGVDYSKRNQTFKLSNSQTLKPSNSQTFKHSNLCWYKNIPVPTSYMVCATKYDFFGGYDHAAEGGFVHVADRHIAPGKKQWTWGNHPFGYAWDRELTDENGPYIELMAGVYTDNQPDFTYLMPYETKTFSQYWWPYQKIGVPQNANREAAVRFTEDSVGIAVSRPMKGAKIRVMRGGKVVKTVKVDLSPERPWIAAGTRDACPYRGDAVVLFDADGNEVIRCEMAAKKRQRRLEEIKGKRAVATEPPAPKDIASADELFLTAEHLDQYRHPTREPEAYLDELLRRDPGDCRAHILYGKRLLSRGLFTEAKDHFAAAVARLTFRHPNPYTGEAHYYLGLALDFLGDDEAAYDAYAKAAWDAAWKSSAETRLAALRSRRGETSSFELRVFSQKNGLSFSSPDMALDAAYDLIDVGLRDEAKELLEQHLKSGRRSAGECDLMVMYVLEWLAAGTRAGSRVPRGRKETPDWFFPSRLWDYRVLRDLWNAGNRSRNIAYGLGNFLYDRKRHEEALQMWKAAVKADPSFATAWRNLGVALWNVRRDANGAIAAYRKAMKANPKDARLVAEYDQLSEKCRVPAAKRRAFLEKNIALVMARDDASVQLAHLRNETGDHEGALKLLALRRFHPWEGGEGKVLREYTAAHLALGFEALKSGDCKAALDHAEKAFDTPENLGEAYHLLQAKADVNYLTGLALRGLGREEEAKAAFAAAADEAGDFQSMAVTEYSELSYYRGLSLAALGRKKEAKALFRGMKAFAEKGLRTPFKIDYFATSLPLLLIFEDDLEAVKNGRMRNLAALAEKGAENV